MPLLEVYLAFNMYSLYIIGPQLESFFGKVKYLIIYIGSAICGNLLSMLFLADNYVSVGASGAIFGLMGSLLYFGYHYRVYLGSTWKTNILPVIVLNLLISIMVPNIDLFGHIGGLIGGFLITIGLGIKYKSSTFEKVNGLIISIIYVVFLAYMAICVG